MSAPTDIPAAHLRLATPAELALPWRLGWSNPWSIYVQAGPVWSKSDPYIGSLHTMEGAAEAVRSHNADRDAEAAGDADYQGGLDDGAKAERERIVDLAEHLLTQWGLDVRRLRSAGANEIDRAIARRLDTCAREVADLLRQPEGGDPA